MYFKTLRLSIAAGLVALAAFSPARAALTGAIFTTDATCTGVNVNIYGSKDAVYIDGGPAHPGAAGLTDGTYCVQVTEPGGAILGTSAQGAVTVLNGEFLGCYQLSSILTKASDGTPGYDDTTNPGGEYKVWVSTDCTFLNSSTKTDAFKVKSDPQTATLCVNKFYDANANGIFDNGELPLIWKVNIVDSINLDRFTSICLTVDPDTYTVTEYAPDVVGTWVASTAPSVQVTLAPGDSTTVVLRCFPWLGGNSFGLT